MAGILDSKERVIDFILTPTGRNQISSGRLKIEFATLTDNQTFYRTATPDGVADDASDRIYFEASQAQSDLITPELENGTEMKGFRAGEFEVVGRRIALGKLSGATNMDQTKILSGSSVTDSAEGFTKKIIGNFKNQRILGTEDIFANSSEFEIGYTTGSFVITERDLELNQGKGIYLKDLAPKDYMGEYEGNPDGIVNLENSPSIFSDPRFDHLPNYKYLPPLNVARAGEDPTPMGIYPKLDNSKDKGNIDDLFSGIKTRQKIEFEFENISRSKNLMCQIFEFVGSNALGGVDKLSIVDNGVFEDPEDGELKQCFYAGKLFKDSSGAHTFINIFTLVFSRSKDQK